MQVKGLVYSFFILFFICLAVFAGTYLYFFNRLPSQDTLGNVGTLKTAFRNWNINTDEVIPKIDQMPPTAFLCSLCHPSKENSDECSEKIQFWVANNLTSSDGPRRAVMSHFMNYFAGKAIAHKYDHSTLIRISMAFSARSLNIRDFNQYCQQKFGKDCVNISTNEAISLGIDVRKGQNTSQMLSLQSEVSTVCAKLK